MKMKREGIGFALCVVLLAAVLIVLEVWKGQTGAKPQSVVMTFGEEAGTTRALTWHSSGAAERGFVQYTEEAGGQVDWKADHVAMVEGEVTRVQGVDGRMTTVHRARIEGLEENQSYVYRVGNGKKGGWSDAAVFRTGNARVDGFTFINVTDSQGETEADFELWGDTVKQAFQQAPDAALIIHNGDLTEEPENTAGWSAFFEKAKPWMTSIPLMPVTGNHDEVDGDATQFAARFYVPDNGAVGSLPGTTYYFDYGDARFIMLNTESNIKGQTRWLAEVLKQNTSKWVIVSLHRGPYGGNRNKDLSNWVELFDEYEVDLVLQGHNHEYSRSYPLRDDKIVEGDASLVRDRAGTIYVVTNAAGQKLNEQKKDQFYHKAHFQNGKRMYAVVRVDELGLTYEAYDVDGQLWDRFVLAR